MGERGGRPPAERRPLEAPETKRHGTLRQSSRGRRRPRRRPRASRRALHVTHPSSSAASSDADAAFAAYVCESIKLDPSPVYGDGVRAALDDPTRTDTFFAPTDDAVEELLNWGGFVEKAKGIDEMLGDVPLTALIVAYHAVPNNTIFSPGLAERGGDAADAADRFLDTALASVLEAASASSADAPGSEPLLVDEYEGDLFLKAVGSEAKVLVRDIKACGSVVHTIDAVLLPIDGDAELEPFQEERLAKIKARAEAAEARSGDARSYETEEEDDDEEDTETSYADVLEDAAAPAPA